MPPDLLILIMSPRDYRDGHFLYGAQFDREGQKRSFWPRKMSSKKDEKESRTSRETASAKRTNAHRINDDTNCHRRGNSSSFLDQASANPALSRESLAKAHPLREQPLSTPTPVMMHTFNSLASAVQHCPWTFGTDLDPTGNAIRDHASSSAFYPRVPRSLMHDSAVSFVVTDHTRPELPRFVISCPLEHVDHVHRLLAPDGSGRVLRARATSGHPRQGDQLRNMLLDGTPNIELAIYGSGERNGNCGLPAENGTGGGDVGLSDSRGNHSEPASDVPSKTDTGRLSKDGGSEHRSTNEGAKKTCPACVPVALMQGFPVPTHCWPGQVASDGSRFTYGCSMPDIG